MKRGKRERLEREGWRVGTAEELLGLSPADVAFIDMKLALAKALATRRAKARVTQVQAAKMLGSSQSRVAKMEAGHPSVSADLLIRSLLALGATPRDVGRALASARTRVRVRARPQSGRVR